MANKRIPPVTRRLAVADVETTNLKDGEKPQTKFWGLKIDGEEYKRFETTKALFAYLRDYPIPLTIYHHHDFDILQCLSDGSGLRISEVRNGRVLQSHGPSHHEWRNSHALFPSPLAEILESCGFEKPGLDDLEARNYADTEYTLQAFKMLAADFYKIWGVDPLCGRYLTAASMAFASAEIAAGPLPLHLQNRDSYRGGRVEAYRVGPCGPADCYDINSSYPASFRDCPKVDYLYYLDCVVDTDGPCPFFALDENEEKLIFPKGRFHTAVWGSNYERYIKPHGGIKTLKIKERIKVDFAWIQRVRERIEHAYALRAVAKAEGKSSLAYSAKIGLNSIYGRLGMKDEREIALFAKSVASGNDVQYYPLGDAGFLSFRKIHTRPKANYLFASFITDNARARLYDGMRKAGDALYCDTDSIYIPKGRVFPLPCGSGLGEWKYEATEPLTVISAKDYTFGTKTVLKGGKASYQWTLKKVLGGKVVKEVRKQRRSVYDKREILPGGRTLPLYFKHW